MRITRPAPCAARAGRLIGTILAVVMIAGPVRASATEAAAPLERLATFGGISTGDKAHQAALRRAADAQPAGPTPYPTDEHDWPGVGVIRVFGFMTQNRTYFWAHRAANQGAVVFAGDSLFGGWTSLKDDFAPLHVANVAIGGEVTRGLLFRLQEDVIALHPRTVVMLIGSNDLSAREDPDLLTANVRSILAVLRDSDASLPIILCTIPPRNYSGAPVPTSEIVDVDRRLSELARSDGKITIVDLYHPLALVDGSPDPRYFEPDLLHPSAAGYRKIHDTLAPVLHALHAN